jgi:hypothetical protein
MDHAEVLERVEAGVASPRHLLALELDGSVNGMALREHLDSCQPCAAEWDAWRIVEDGLAAATPDTMKATAARERILAAVVAQGVARGPDLVLTVPQTQASTPLPTQSPVQAQTPAPTPLPQPPGRSGPSAARSRPDAPTRQGGLPFKWLALGAAATVLLFVAGALLGGPLGLTQQSDTTSTELARVIAAAGDALAASGHTVAALRTADGAPGGAAIASPTTAELIVMSAALPPLEGGRRYACLLVRDGTRTKVGYMHFSGTVAYWAGPVKDPADPGQPGDEFVVVPEDAVTQPPTLSGTFS